MQMINHKIVYKNNRTANIFYPKDFINNKECELPNLKENIETMLEANIGFQLEGRVLETLRFEVFGYRQQKTKITSYTLDVELATKLISKTIIRCAKNIELSKRIKIFVLPTYNKFIIQKMSGVGAFTLDSNTILLFLSPRKNWEKNLINTVAHEYAHSITYRYHSPSTLLDSLVFEGIAENFRDKVIGGLPTPLVKTLGKKRAHIILNDIRPHLNSTATKYYLSIFLGWDKKYPVWSGYSIGYHIVKSYLSDKTNLAWDTVFKENPANIFTGSTFFLQDQNP